jgi:transcriptional regulator with XRE-family HTH domain
MANTEPVVRFNAQLLAEDMAARGLNKDELAAKAGVADMTVIRFLRGDSQTGKTAKKLARALGYRSDRYIVRASSEEEQRASA